MTVLVTGAAGFIGHHVSRALIARGERVVGCDIINDYYDPALKRARLAAIGDRPEFRFEPVDITSLEDLKRLRHAHGFDRIVHLAAQPGVPYSLEHPFAYVEANLRGHLAVIELARAMGEDLVHLVYASSSSVYGGRSKVPYSESEPADTPVSLYAATKRADELMSYSYAHLFGVKQTGLRFFTVYGEFGRPDMSYWIFTKAILEGAPVVLYNDGKNLRDFTHVDDIVKGVLDVLDHPPEAKGGEPPHRVFNIGNNRSEIVLDVVSILEEAIGRKAQRVLKPARLGDVYETHADISALHALTGFTPTTAIADGLPRFVEWYRRFYGV